MDLVSDDPAAFRRRDHAAINALWIGLQFQDAALLAIILPAILLRLAPATHTSVLAVLSTLAAIATTVVPPFAGALSDRGRRAGGDRRLHTAIVLLIDAVALVLMGLTSTVVGIGVMLVVATVTFTATGTIYQVLIPEIVPRRFWGVASGYRGAMTLLGTIAGLLTAALLPSSVALYVTAGLIAVSAISLMAVPSVPVTTTAERPHVVLGNRFDLTVTMVARAWLVLGIALLNTYALYFFHDILGVRDASLGTGLVAGAALIGAVVSSIVVGIVSDRLDRRITVFVSGIPMVVAALGFALFPSYHLVFIYAVFFGAGYGGVFSVGWALALDAIPDMADVARDLGVWWTLSNLPGIVAPALGAFIIMHGATPADGYRWMFAVAAGCFALGSVTVLAVRHGHARTTSTGM